jgi:hypothetical protein
MNAFATLLRVYLFTIVFTSLAATSSVDARLFKKEVPAVQKRNKAFTGFLRIKPKSYDLPYAGWEFQPASALPSQFSSWPL